MQYAQYTAFNDQKRIPWATWTLWGGLALGVLFVVSRYNFLLFHILAEFLSIAVAWSVFILVWNTRDIVEEKSLVFLGVAYLFVGFVDVLHTVSYKGMSVFAREWGANLPTQLWIMGRYMETAALSAYPFLIKRELRINTVIAVFLGATVILLGSVFYWPLFPDCYIEGSGLTPFKIVSEYLLCITLGAAMWLLSSRRRELDRDVYRFMMISIGFTILAELSFTFYVSVYSLSNIVGHFFKLLSFFFVYLALVRSSLIKPYSLLFKSLKQSYARMEEKVHRRTRALEAAAFEFESLFNASQVGLMVLKGGRCFSKGNQRLADILGYGSPGEMAGLSMRALHLNEARFLEFGRTYYDSLAQGEVLQVAYELKRKDGRPVWCSLSGKALDPVDSDHPKDLKKGVLWVIDDISRRKAHEAELKKTMDELEVTNSELAQFAYVASHDLQEPLRAIVGFLQLLEANYPDKLDEKGRHYIDRSVKAGHRMQVLINDLLALSRISTRGGEFEPVEMEEVFTQALKRLDSRIRRTNARVTSGPLPRVSADKRQMVTLVRNLVSNGLKYNETSPPVIETGCKTRENDYCFYVKDNGIGIDPRFFDRIFIVFQRLHGREEYSGTGIGLTLCKKIVERHSGRIWVESREGRGSTFFFTLPKDRI